MRSGSSFSQAGSLLHMGVTSSHSQFVSASYMSVLPAGVKYTFDRDDTCTVWLA
ncbi:hypothetical protein D3C85_200480 [compost metagenome]